MCRSIRVLSKSDSPASSEDVHAAARQFVRKIGGFARPSKVNEPAFDLAVQEIAAIAETFLGSIEIRATAKKVAVTGQ
jgi:hypothetical protein